MPDQYVDFPEWAADPGNPAANVLRVFAKDDGAGTTAFYKRDSAGVTVALGGAAGADGVFNSVAVGAATGPDGEASGMFLSSNGGISTQRSAGGALLTNWTTAGDDFPRLKVLGSGEHRLGAGGNTLDVDVGFIRFSAGSFQITDGTSSGFGNLRCNSLRHGMTGSGATLGFFNVTAVARAAAMTQNYATANRTHAPATSAAVSVTSTLAGFGYATAAQADSIPVEINNLVADIVNLKQFVNAIVDDLQAYGLEQ